MHSASAPCHQATTQVARHVQTQLLLPIQRPSLCPHLQHDRLLRPRSRASAGFDRDPFFEFTPFMSREMAIMDQQMEQMSQQMDVEMSRMMGLARRMEAQANQQVEQALQQAQSMEPGVQIRRSEERGVNSYRYYESISIYSGPRVYAVATATPAAVSPSPYLFVVALLVGGWAALAAAFARNIQFTTFKDQAGWKLGLAWPFLLVTNTKFREQFLAAVRGRRAPATQSADEL